MSSDFVKYVRKTFHSDWCPTTVSIIDAAFLRDCRLHWSLLDQQIKARILLSFLLLDRASVENFRESIQGILSAEDSHIERHEHSWSSVFTNHIQCLVFPKEGRKSELLADSAEKHVVEALNSQEKKRKRPTVEDINTDFLPLEMAYLSSSLLGSEYKLDGRRIPDFLSREGSHSTRSAAASSDK
jgi:hypothetical protein